MDRSQREKAAVGETGGEIGMRKNLNENPPAMKTE